MPFESVSNESFEAFSPSIFPTNDVTPVYVFYKAGIDNETTLHRGACPVQSIKRVFEDARLGPNVKVMIHENGTIDTPFGIRRISVPKCKLGIVFDACLVDVSAVCCRRQRCDVQSGFVAAALARACFIVLTSAPADLSAFSDSL